MNIFIGGSAAVLMVGLLFFEHRQHQTGKILTKLPLSALFILTAYLQTSPLPVYRHLLLAGLTCCLVGDGCLVFPRQGIFLAGLATFLLGHAFYLAAFLSLSGFNAGTAGGLLLTGSLGYGILRWLQPYLNGMRKPVVAYIAVISLMVSAAAAVFFDPHISMPLRRLVLVGALFFYLSDLFVARQRFVRNRYINRLAGLPLYYGGQFCLALSVGMG